MRYSKTRMKVYDDTGMKIYDFETDEPIKLRKKIDEIIKKIG